MFIEKVANEGSESELNKTKERKGGPKNPGNRLLPDGRSERGKTIMGLQGNGIFQIRWWNLEDVHCTVEYLKIFTKNTVH